MPTAVAAPVESPFTIHLSARRNAHAGLLDALADRPLLSRVVRALSVGHDLDDVGAADALGRLVSRLGWGTVHGRWPETPRLSVLTAQDQAAARALGGAIKPVVFAELTGFEMDGGQESARCPQELETERDGGQETAGYRQELPGGTEVGAFVGRAFLPWSEPLASIDDTFNGIRLDGQHARGPRCHGSQRSIVAIEPRTSWLVRLTFPGLVPSDQTVLHIIAPAGLAAERIEGAAFSSTTRWLFVGVHARDEVTAALARLSHAHRLITSAFRRF